jgi:membrane dipeptidase
MHTDGSRFSIPFRAALTGLLLCAACSGPAPETPEADPISAILKGHMVVDPAVTTRFFRFPEEPETPFDPAALLADGIDVAVLGVGTVTEALLVGDLSNYWYTSPPPGYVIAHSVFTGADAVKRFLWEIDAVHETASAHPQVELARTAKDLERYRAEGKLSLMLGVDSGIVVEDLATLRVYHKLGLRRLELAHAFPASWADACSGILDDDDLGLNDFGLEVVRECNRLGILVDLSHSSDRTMEEAIEVSEKPVIASHSGARGVVDAVRNLTDDQIKALAQKGGLIAVGAMYDPKHLEPIRKTGAWITMAKVNNYLLERYPDPFRLAAAIRNPAETQEALQTLDLEPLSSLHKVRPRSGIITQGASVEGTLDHIDYIVKLVGIDHVSIGTDTDIRREDYTWLYRQFVSGLLERGYSEEEIVKILSGNFLRVLRANEG